MKIYYRNFALESLHFGSTMVQISAILLCGYFTLRTLQHWMGNMSWIITFIHKIFRWFIIGNTLMPQASGAVFRSWIYRSAIWSIWPICTLKYFSFCFRICNIGGIAVMRYLSFLLNCKILRYLYWYIFTLEFYTFHDITSILAHHAYLNVKVSFFRLDLFLWWFL